MSCKPVLGVGMIVLLGVGLMIGWPFGTKPMPRLQLEWTGIRGSDGSAVLNLFNPGPGGVTVHPRYALEIGKEGRWLAVPMPATHVLATGEFIREGGRTEVVPRLPTSNGTARVVLHYHSSRDPASLGGRLEEALEALGLRPRPRAIDATNPPLPK